MMLTFVNMLNPKVREGSVGSDNSVLPARNMSIMLLQWSSIGTYGPTALEISRAMLRIVNIRAIS